MPRLLPLFHERVVSPRVAIAAVALGTQPDGGQWSHEVALADSVDVLLTSAVAALALDVVIHSVLDAIPPDVGTDCGIAPAVHGMAAETGILLS